MKSTFLAKMLNLGCEKHIVMLFGVIFRKTYDLEIKSKDMRHDFVVTVFRNI